ncbi:MAG TPA: DsrE/DsrF/DrsH-like family protein [Candidatus Limnocylindrales bacterium]|nr:DsrE/DsrF/DrsH-like family protein [Candidatus Limnocylindrales bacterium]
MTTTTLERPVPARPESEPFDPLAEAIADGEGLPESSPEPAMPASQTATKELVIVNWSGDLDKVWPVLILSSTAAASGVRCRVFVTFWGLLPFVRDQKRIVGENWMQRMLTLMQRPGIDHLKLSKMNFLGMGPWMMGSLRKRYGVASPRELLDAATAMGVEFIPCQMTMDMFGLTRDDLIPEMGEPAGAATAIEIITEADASLFI